MSEPVKVLARDWVWEIEDQGDYIRIGGIESFSPSPTKSDADGTDFDSQGWEEHQVATRGVSYTLEGFYKEDPDTGLRDAGQEAVEALANRTGRESLGDFRLTSPGGTTITFKASADIPTSGGGHNDNTSWSATVRMSGPPTKALAS